MDLTKMYDNAEVVYLLGRGAHLEHPHMIEVQYPSHQRGPTLQGTLYVHPHAIF